MARVYKPIGPSSDKMAEPVTETKAPQEKTEKPSKKQKSETGEQ